MSRTRRRRREDEELLRATRPVVRGAGRRVAVGPNRAVALLMSDPERRGRVLGGAGDRLTIRRLAEMAAAHETAAALRSDRLTAALASGERGGAGDALAALAGVPAVVRALERLRAQAIARVARDYGALRPGTPQALVTTGVVLPGGALGRLDRRCPPGTLDGRLIRVAALAGLSVRLWADARGVRALFCFDVTSVPAATRPS